MSCNHPVHLLLRFSAQENSLLSSTDTVHTFIYSSYVLAYLTSTDIVLFQFSWLHHMTYIVRETGVYSVEQMAVVSCVTIHSFTMILLGFVFIHVISVFVVTKC